VIEPMAEAKLRTIIVDDEPLALRLLKSLLADSPDIDIIAECRNGREAVEATLEMLPDLMFLDIQMPGMDGFDVVKSVQADAMPMVIFCTAFAQYALDAFDVHAVDYILKPIDKVRIQRAVERALDRHKQSAALNEKPALIGAIDDIAKKIKKESSSPERELRDVSSTGSSPGMLNNKIAIKDSDTITMVSESDIDWVDAAGDYMCIHALGVTHILRSTMKDLLNKLDKDLFKRVHRSTIVNLNRIEKVTPHTKGEYFLQLTNGEHLKVSRNYREAIKTFLSDS